MSKDTTPADPNHEHYAWGASNAKTWRGCKGSINFTAEERAKGNIPESSDTKWSSDGTVAHDWADRYLKGEVTREEIPPNVYESIEGYLDHAEEMKSNRPEAEVFTEQKVNLFYETTKVGTLDFAVADPLMVEILDYKNGFQPVDADENDQAIIYCNSLMIKLEKAGYEFTDDTICRMWIYQPNELAFDGVAKMWETTYRDLKDICLDIFDDYLESKSAPTDDLTPSHGACLFCKAKATCTKRVIEMFDDVPEGTNMLVPASQDMKSSLPIISNLDDAARVAIYTNHKEITKWMNDVNANSLALIDQGTPIEGMKVCDGKQGNRGWGDNELDAEKLLRKLPVALRYKPRRVLSPAQAETALKKFDKEDPDTKSIFTKRFVNRFDELIYRKPGKPVLALESDKRPARASAIESFDEEEAIEVETSKVVEDDDCF